MKIWEWGVNVFIYLSTCYFGHGFDCLFWLFIIVMMPVVIIIVMVLGFHGIFLLYFDCSDRWLEPSLFHLMLTSSTTTGVVLPFIPTDSAQRPTAEWLVGITIYYRHPQEISSHVNFVSFIGLLSCTLISGRVSLPASWSQCHDHLLSVPRIIGMNGCVRTWSE